jgi:DNA (cytosine-5)-methyltransferase 1
MTVLEEAYGKVSGGISRTVVAGRLKGKGIIEAKVSLGTPLAHQWWQYVLRGVRPTICCDGAIRTIDLFCGTGGLSLGASEAIEAVGMNHVPMVAIDIDGEAAAVYKRNFAAAHIIQANVASMIDYHVYGRGDSARFAYDPELVDRRLGELVGRVDLVLAGPPCQGHSNLNNHTRRSDPRNMLYVSAAAAVVALRARMAVIENVPEVLSDKTDVVATARKVLLSSGYSVSTAVLSATNLGAAQTRKRHFLIATQKPHFDIGGIQDQLARPPMTLREVIGDLEHAAHSTFMDAVPVLSAENQARIDYLFQHELHDLPNDIRPDCHKNGHTYPSVYGRMYWDKPAQTITTGFNSPGRGRYIHPVERRVITAREAARIQGFPDNFVFMPNGHVPSRSLLCKWIGDAVPSWIGYPAVLGALSGY